MKRNLSILFFFTSLLCIHSGSAAQTYNPAWYVYGQPYLKITVNQDGVYRVSGQQLADNGINLSTLNPQTLRLIENGQEIPIYVSGGSSMTTSDYIEFIGKRNTGADEAWAYDHPNSQSSKEFSIYTDKTVYWLTYGGAFGLRYQSLTPNFYASGATPKSLSTHLEHLETDAAGYHYGDGDIQTGNPLYSRGEAFFTSLLTNTSTSNIEVIHNIPLSLPSVSTTDSVSVWVRMSSGNSTRHKVGVKALLKSGATTVNSELGLADWVGYGYGDVRFKIAQSDLPSLTNLQLTVVSYNDYAADRPTSYLDFIKTTYVRSISAFSSQLNWTSQAGRFTYTVGGMSSGNAYVLDPVQRRRFVVPISGGTATFSNELSAETTQSIFLDSHVKSPLSIVQEVNADLVNVSNRADYLIITTNFLKPSAQQIANYRQSKDGFVTYIADVNDIFDQFDYGRPTPIAIRRFLQQTQNWNLKPRYVLLWGDAKYPSRSRDLETWEVPSFGRPTSDGWFVMQTGGDRDFTEKLSIGRLNVRTNEEGVNVFLPKLTNYENNAPAYWNKKLISLSGGNTAFEQQILSLYTKDWIQMFQDHPTGMDYYLLSKSSSQVLDASQIDSLHAHIAQGASWMTYFGHSSAFTWEIVTKPFAQWNNAPKLPVILSLGCYTGVFAGDNSNPDSKVFAEDLVLGSQQGGIAHWGGSASSYINYTADMLKYVIPVVSRDTVRTLGDIFRKGKANYLNAYFPSGLNPLQNYYEASHILQYNLIGDPATHVQIAKKPDFHVDNQSITITPLTPLPADGHLNVSVRILNYGLTPSDSVRVDINQTTPGGIVKNYFKKIAKFKSDTTVVFNIPIDETMVGENQVQAVVDAPNSYNETNELDNSTTKAQVIYSKGLNIVCPMNYGVATMLNPTLRVSLSSADPNNRVIFELDSLGTFNSPFKITSTVATTSAAADWIPPTSLSQGKTYYWRTRLDEPSQVNNWKVGVFTVRTDLADGWYQQGDLFEDNTEDNLTFTANNHWDVAKYSVTFRSNSGFSGPSRNQFVVNGELYQRVGLGVGLIVLDGKTGAVKAHRSSSSCVNSLRNHYVEWPLMKQMIAEAATGDYLIFRSRFFCPTPTIEDSIKQVFRDLGSVAIDTMTYNNSKPWAFYTRKNMTAGHSKDFDARSLNYDNADWSKDTVFVFNRPFGQTTSPLFGPALSWQNVRWESNIPSGDPNQSIVVDILAEDGTVLIAGIEAANLPASLNSIDAAVHPYIRLRGTLKDVSQSTTPQLLNWHVGYQPIPEIALDFLNLSTNSLQEGQPLNVSVRVHNLSKQSAGPLSVNLFLTNAANQTTLVHTQNIASLDASSTVDITKELATLNLVGNNILTASVVQTGKNESVTYNNQLVKTFTVSRDARVPEFAITVDGLSLPNDPNPVVNPNSAIYPYVSANPRIEITLTDENQYLLLNDPALFTLTFNGVPVPLNRADVQFIPGTAPNNQARIIFTPNLSQASGTYSLSFNAKDASGNAIAAYQAHFKVQNEFAIDNLYPYPNPMSTSTDFVFNLKGASVAGVETFGLKIYTLSGKLVREFDLLAPNTLVVPMKIGWNKLRWDGTDADGDALATGTYLYKIHFKADGKEVSVNNENSIEKLVIIR